METSPETRYSLGAVFSAIFQVCPPSSEAATLALICHATAICCGFLGFTAIEGSLKYPGLGVMSTTWALGAGASCWSKTEEANNRIARHARKFINEVTFYNLPEHSAFSTQPTARRGLRHSVRTFSGQREAIMWAC